MADRPKKARGDSRTQIIVAVIGVVGVVIAALLTNWDKIVGVKSTQQTPQPLAQPLAPAAPREILVNFSGVDTATAPGHIVAADPYLHRLGITVEKRAPERSQLILINNRAVYQGRAVQPTTSQNLLTQADTGNVRASFTLMFSDPLESVTFMRPALYPATNSGITHPAWSAHALDAEGRQLSSQSEGIIRSFVDVPARTYTLTAPGFEGIAAVRFDSDPRLDGVPFAAFSAILIERLTLIRRGK